MKTKEEKKIETALNKQISENIKSILKFNGYTPYTFQKMLKESEKYVISYPYLTKILNKPEENTIPLVYLIQCCQFFGITLDAIVSPNLTADQCIPQKETEFKKVLDSIKIVEGNSDNGNETLPPKPPNDFQEESSNNLYFIEDPNNGWFKSYLQTYYCYFYPTVSSENKTVDSMLSGTLTLEADGDKCTVTLRINTKKEKNNNVVYKTYKGTAVISSVVQNVYCVLKSNEIGEFCYIIFRHYHLNFAYQDCHMAAVLSTSSAGKDRKRYPTILRMFLSREAIKPEDLRFLAPHLWLNYSQITISEKDLMTLKDADDKYKEIVKDLLNNADSELMYLFKEKEVVAYAKKCLDDEEVIHFLTELRLQSYAYRYHKVSDTAEDTVRNLLISLGYYEK